MDHTRRDALAGGALALSLATAGCLDFAAGDGPQGPEGTPATLTCEDEGFVRLDRPFEASVTETLVETAETTVELSTEGTTETYGQSLRLVLRNTGDAPMSTRGESAYSIQRETGEGWLDVRGSTTGEAVELPRSESSLDTSSAYSWDITLTESGIADAVDGVDLAVCPPLGPGTYRFVYWGLVDAPPIGAEFELVG
ncbi:hypothetical protein C470_11227 [Halorubrum distributum JCM 13561]|uniref:Uncharacterized protein n=2 Tax=Halorubrum distributum TaxID=29283 RepID=M0NPG1_9EURY|nr:MULTISPECIES: DUF6517 family protein [Halorubrum distributum group]EMA59054.1 hypothetical protein C470_11227 [Halorubrum litoreum JCM 13561]EMA69375.1 hypothetical protein C462_12492 [Halorubrum arcis JCM 13916]MDV7350824.1 DUF6517 family protein [Halorubrum distributum]